jgi:surface antigen
MNMRQELSIIKPLLLQWALAYVLIVVIVSNALYLALSDGNGSRKLQKITPRPAKNQQSKAKLSSGLYRQSSIALKDVKKPKPSPPRTNTAAKTAGNGYAWGNCTWYAKSKRPDLPNNLGNAYSWVSQASAQGLPTGVEPRVGAIGQQGMHVVYVESVNDDGTISISEMNYHGFGVVSTRTVPVGTFEYIY